MHYNEFQAIKLARQLMAEEEEEDEDEEEDTQQPQVCGKIFIGKKSARPQIYVVFSISMK